MARVLPCSVRNCHPLESSFPAAPALSSGGSALRRISISRAVFCLLIWLAGPAVGKEGRPPTPGDDAVLCLAPLNVAVRPLTSFGLGLAVVANHQTRRIEKIFIWKVAENSEAEMKGLEPGDEILKVDGDSAQSLVVRFDPESKLRQSFVGRKRGDRIRLEIASSRGGRPREVSLTEGRDASPEFLWRLFNDTP